MDEYISRDAVMDMLQNQHRKANSMEAIVLIADIRHAARVIPTADVEEVVHGEWVTDEEDLAWGNSLKRKHCSECSGRPHWDNDEREFILAKFCHHCGAKMDGRRVSK